MTPVRVLPSVLVTQSLNCRSRLAPPLAFLVDVGGAKQGGRAAFTEVCGDVFVQRSGDGFAIQGQAGDVLGDGFQDALSVAVENAREL